jgi:tetratricopeptide (TPR) repeat protein
MLIVMWPKKLVLAFFVLASTLTVAQEAKPPDPRLDPTAVNGGESELSPARKLVQQGKYDQALDELNELAKDHPGLTGIDREFGFTRYAKGDFLEAATSLKKAITENPADKEAVQLLGLSLYLAGRAAEAIPYLEKLQSWFPRANIDASYILGICYIQTKDYPHARSAFAKMFDVAPDSAASYLFTARMLFRQEFDPVAEEYGLKAVSLDPKLPLAHFLLGELYLFKSRVPEAIAEFQKELAINPANAATYYKLADAYSRVQKYEDAERLLQRSIWLDSTSTGPYILMGKVLEKKGELELAVRALQRAAAMDPNNPTTHHLLGQAYRDMGKKEEAETELKLAEQLQKQAAQ